MKVRLKHGAMAAAGVATVVALLAGGESKISERSQPLARTETAYSSYEAMPFKSIERLPQRADLGRQLADIFAADSPPPPLPLANVQAPPAPVPPPLPYRFAGSVLHDGKLRTLITDGDRIYEVESGDELNGQYRVETVTADEVVIVYKPLGSRHPLAAKWAFSSEPADIVASGNRALGDSP